jgi:hypothetical protein
VRLRTNKNNTIQITVEGRSRAQDCEDKSFESLQFQPQSTEKFQPNQTTSHPGNCVRNSSFRCFPVEFEFARSWLFQIKCGREDKKKLREMTTAMGVPQTKSRRLYRKKKSSAKFKNQCNRCHHAVIATCAVGWILVSMALWFILRMTGDDSFLLT